MVKHIILWTLKEEFSAEEKEQIKKGIKENLEGLVGKVPGLLSLHIQTEKLPSSTADLMLDSSLESAEALKGPLSGRLPRPARALTSRSRTRIDHGILLPEMRQARAA